MIEVPESCQSLVTPAVFEQYTRSPSSPDVRAKLAKLSLDDLFPQGYSDSEMAECCLSGLWLLHNFLHDSHEISQEIDSAEGSYWHGIMHRMEGDFWNSKYWFNKVGSHPVFDDVALNWNPAMFTDQCEANPNDDEVQAIAVKEWQSLFSYCYQQA